METLMQTINIHAAKTQLSRLVEQAAAGEEIIIAKAGKPVCRLMPLLPAPETTGPRQPGTGAGSFEVRDESDVPLPAELPDTSRDDPASDQPARAMIARFAGCWNDLSDDDFAALETERQARRSAASATLQRRRDDATDAG
jgi:prevent-host-death family protein